MPLFGSRGAASVTGFGGLAKLRYLLRNSLRFRASASAYLNKTLGTPTNANKFTFSLWVKRGKLSSAQTIFSVSNTNYIQFNASDNIQIVIGNSVCLTTSAVYRDPAAWYHFVFSFDNSASPKWNFYANGVNGGTGTLGSATFNTAVAHYIANIVSGGGYFDGEMTETNFIDGQALTPNAFGTFNSYGVWQPITYGGSYGTNGFYLPFTNKTSTTTLGYDFSPAGNNWTTNNISLTAGATYDSMTDVPTLTSTTAANYAVLNPLNSTATISYANLQWNSNGNLGASSTIAPNSGKWYAEFTFSAINSSVVTFGVSNLLTSSAFNGATQTWQLGYTSAGKLENAGSQTTVATYTTGDVVAVAFDCSTGAVTFYKNNTSIGTITNASFANVPVMLGIGSGGVTTGTSTGYANFGQQPFTYTPPSGFVALNTYNL